MWKRRTLVQNRKIRVNTVHRKEKSKGKIVHVELWPTWPNLDQYQRFTALGSCPSNALLILNSKSPGFLRRFSIQGYQGSFNIIILSIGILNEHQNIRQKRGSNLFS